MCAKCQENTQPAKKEVPFIGALADIEVRIDACRSVTGCILEYLPPTSEDSGIAFHINEIGNLATALADILDLCRADVKRAYEQLEQRGKS